MPKAVVVGSGVGGLATAIDLAADGVEVTILEAAGAPGGKAGTHEVDGVRFDTGPSVLTMTTAIDGLLRRAGTCLDDHLTLRRPEPGFRYLFPDGVQVDVHHSVKDSIDSVKLSLGSEAAEDLERFLGYSERIWTAVSPHFVYGDAPTLTGVAALGPAAWASLRHIDALRSMWAAIRGRVRSPHLRAILARYATYNGSDPRIAPATLNCIAHVELAMGGFGIEGGMGALVQVLVGLAEQLGVRLRCGARVSAVRLAGDKVTGLELEDGEQIEVDTVVINADVAHLVEDLLPAGQRGAPPSPTPPSMSGWTAVVRAAAAPARAAHTVVMSDPYLNEFADIFDHHRPPTQPTVYLCAQSTCHGIQGWSDGEPVFLMVNAPPEPAGGSDPAVWDQVRAAALERAQAAGVIGPQDPVVWERTPAGLAARFPGSRGSLYGAASHGMMAAFKRPPNRLPRIPGLFLASGSAHPGGGVPMAVLSGRAAARAVRGWWGS